MKAYVTKCCLTTGIVILDGQVSETCSTMLCVPGKYHDNYYHQGAWFDNLAAAVHNANERKARKLVSLRKQIAKLEAMEFHE